MRLVALGLLSALLYALLFIEEERVRTWLVKGDWYALIPIAAALLFSLVHGAFTGRFWTALGVTARTPPPQDRPPR